MGIIWGKERLFLVGGKSSREPVGPGLQEELAAALFKLCRPPAKEVVLELRPTRYGGSTLQDLIPETLCLDYWQGSKGTVSLNAVKPFYCTLKMALKSTKGISRDS